jgi:hypothetical protein
LSVPSKTSSQPLTPWPRGTDVRRPHDRDPVADCLPGLGR